MTPPTREELLQLTRAVADAQRGATEALWMLIRAHAAVDGDQPIRLEVPAHDPRLDPEVIEALAEHNSWLDTGTKLMSRMNSVVIPWLRAPSLPEAHRALLRAAITSGRQVAAAACPCDECVAARQAASAAVQGALASSTAQAREP